MISLLTIALALLLQTAAGWLIQSAKDWLDPHQAHLNRQAAQNLKNMHDAGYF